MLEPGAASGGHVLLLTLVGLGFQLAGAGVTAWGARLIWRQAATEGEHLLDPATTLTRRIWRRGTNSLLRWLGKPRSQTIQLESISSAASFGSARLSVSYPPLGLPPAPVLDPDRLGSSTAERKLVPGPTTVYRSPWSWAVRHTNAARGGNPANQPASGAGRGVSNRRASGCRRWVSRGRTAGGLGRGNGEPCGPRARFRTRSSTRDA